MTLKETAANTTRKINSAAHRFYQATSNFIAQLLSEEAIRNTATYKNKEGDIEILKREKSGLQNQLRQNEDSLTEERKRTIELEQYLQYNASRQNTLVAKNEMYRKSTRRAVDLISNLQARTSKLEDALNEQQEREFNEALMKIGAIEEVLKKEWRTAIEEATQMYDKMNARREKEKDEVIKELADERRQIGYLRGHLTSKEEKLKSISSGAALALLFTSMEPTTLKDTKAIYFNSERKPVYATPALLKLFSVDLKELERVDLTKIQENEAESHSKTITIKAGRYEESLDIHPVAFEGFGTFYIIDYHNKALTRAISHSGQDLRAGFYYLVDALRRRQFRTS